MSSLGKVPPKAVHSIKKPGSPAETVIEFDGFSCVQEATKEQLNEGDPTNQSGRRDPDCTGTSHEVTDDSPHRHKHSDTPTNSTFTEGSSESEDSSLRHLAFAEAYRILSDRFGRLPPSTSATDKGSECWEYLFPCSHKVFTVPRFSKRELALGKRLGKGSFSNVDEIRGIMLRHSSHKCPLPQVGPSSVVKPSASKLTAFPDALKKIARPSFGLKREDTMANNDHESRSFMAQHCYRFSGDTRYAIKMVRRDVFDSGAQSNIIAGVCDLAVETIFLSSLEHPNIIKLRGIADMPNPFASEYFLVLDRLRDTLQRRISCTWKAKEDSLYSAWGRFRDRRGRQRLDFFEHRLERAFDLGSAIEYLHQKKIIHRDIKPE